MGDFAIQVKIKFMAKPGQQLSDRELGRKGFVAASGVSFRICRSAARAGVGHRACRLHGCLRGRDEPAAYWRLTRRPSQRSDARSGRGQL